MIAKPPAVVDTNVVSYLFKRDSRAYLYRPHTTDRLLFVSFMTIAELDRWVLRHNWGASKRALLAAHASQFVMLSVDRQLCLEWAKVSEEARRNGRPIEPGDAWIAATARLHGFPLITHNADDFAGVERLSIITERPA